MTIQVLISTMHQTDHSLLEKMNIQTDAVVINQCDTNRTQELRFRGHRVIWIDSDERGVGKSRNRAIMASDADILLFADDDVVYADGYGETVADVFARRPNMTLAVFNLESLNPKRPEPMVKKDYRLRWHNCLKFGAFRIAACREAVLKNTLWFSLLFGGGAPYKAGEDNLFITQCLQRGMVGWACSKQLGTVAQMESTWFTGYDEKYFRDRGALFAAMHGKWAKTVLCLFEIRTVDKLLFWRLRCGFGGIDAFLKLRSPND